MWHFAACRLTSHSHKRLIHPIISTAVRSNRSCYSIRFVDRHGHFFGRLCICIGFCRSYNDGCGTDLLDRQRTGRGVHVDVLRATILDCVADCAFAVGRSRNFLVRVAVVDGYISGGNGLRCLVTFKIRIHLILSVLLAGYVDAGIGAEHFATRALRPVYELVAVVERGGEGVGGRLVALAGAGHVGRAVLHVHRAVAVSRSVVAVIDEAVVAFFARQPGDGVLRTVEEINVDVRSIHPSCTVASRPCQRTVKFNGTTVNKGENVGQFNVSVTPWLIVSVELSLTLKFVQVMPLLRVPLSESETLIISLLINDIAYTVIAVPPKNPPVPTFAGIAPTTRAIASRPAAVFFHMCFIIKFLLLFRLKTFKAFNDR